VDRGRFGSDRLRSEFVPVQQNVNIYRETTNITKITYNNNQIINQGPDYDEISKVSERPIRRLRLEREERRADSERDGGGGDRKSRIEGDTLKVVGLPPEAAAPRPDTTDRPAKGDDKPDGRPARDASEVREPRRESTPSDRPRGGETPEVKPTPEVTTPDTDGRRRDEPRKKGSGGDRTPPTTESPTGIPTPSPTANGRKGSSAPAKPEETRTQWSKKPDREPTRTQPEAKRSAPQAEKPEPDGVRREKSDSKKRPESSEANAGEKRNSPRSNAQQEHSKQQQKPSAEKSGERTSANPAKSPKGKTKSGKPQTENTEETEEELDSNGNKKGRSNR